MTSYRLKNFAKQIVKPVREALRFFCFKSFYLLICDISAPAPFSQASGKLIIRRATHNDINGIGSLLIDLKTAHSRLSEEEHCYIAFLNDKIAGIGWIHFGSCFIRGAGLIIENKESLPYIYGISTKMEARRNGVYKGLLDFMDTELRKAGHTKTLRLVETKTHVVLNVLFRRGV